MDPAALIVVTGPPGAGKSTVARILAARFELSALAVGDDFFGFIARGYIDPWRRAAHRQNEVVIRAAAAAAGRLALGGYTVVYDGVLGPWFLRDFVAEAGVGAVQYAILMPAEEDCLRRVTTRPDHPFTDLDATRQMHREFERSAIERRHVIVNQGSPEEAAEEVLRRLAAGELEWEEPSFGP
jgi:cytidylate kinase